MQLVDISLKPLFKYERDNLGTIKELLSTRARFQDSFNANIKTDTAESYANNKLDQWKVRVTEPSKNGTVLRYQHGFFSNQVVAEASRMFNNLSQKLSHQFGEFCS